MLPGGGRVEGHVRHDHRRAGDERARRSPTATPTSWRRQITDNYDIVFIDQRGVGASQPVRCDEAAAAYYLNDADPDDPAQRDDVAAAAQSFVDDCIAEAASPPRTCRTTRPRQAVEDLEAIRQYLDVEQIVLYGESYGTQFVQTYAAAHPDNVSMLILDGVVDLTVDGLTVLRGGRAGPRRRARGTCSRRAPPTRRARSTPAATPSPPTTPSRRRSTPARSSTTSRCRTAPSSARTFDASDLELAAAGTVGSLGDRMLLQRAVTAAADGNLVPLARLAYSSVYVDPETLEVVRRPVVVGRRCTTQSSARTTRSSPTPGRRGSASTRGSTRAPRPGIDDLRLGSVFYGDLPCLYWPAQPGDVPRPGADRRPAVPDARAQRRHRRADAGRQRDARVLADGRLVPGRCSRAARTSSSTGGTRASTTSSAKRS